MILMDLFHQLETPAGGRDTLSAMPIPGAPSSRIAKDSDGYPVLLFALTSSRAGLRLKSYRLKYLGLIHNVKCTVREAGKEAEDTFTLVRFTSLVPQMQSYFIHYAESLVQIVEANPTLEQFADALQSLVDIFSMLDQAPVKSVQGLWAELFMINKGQDSKTLLSFWHARPEEKFDFNSGTEKIEVKSSSSLERVHYFSSDQLNPSTGSRALIASILVRQSSDGWSTQQLINSIAAKAEGDLSLISKLNLIIVRTLGTSLEGSIDITFDYAMANESIQLYSTDDIPKISDAHIPKGVTEVRFKSSLKPAKAIDISVFPGKGRLFGAMMA